MDRDSKSDQQVSSLFGKALPSRDFNPSIIEQPTSSDEPRSERSPSFSARPRTPQEMELLIPTLSFLVVDDVRCTCEVIVTLLRSLGAKSNKLFSATTLFGAMQLMRSHKIDVIISDLNLRVGTGLDLLEAVRVGPYGSKVAFMLVTNEPGANEIKKAKEMGVTAVLLKPLSMGNISEHLAYAIPE